MPNYKILTAEDEKRIRKAVARYLVENIDNGKAYAQGVRAAWRTYGKTLIFPADLIKSARKDFGKGKAQKNKFLRDWYEGYSVGCLVIAENA